MQCAARSCLVIIEDVDTDAFACRYIINFVVVDFWERERAKKEVRIEEVNLVSYNCMWQLYKIYKDSAVHTWRRRSRIT